MVMVPREPDPILMSVLASIVRRTAIPVGGGSDDVYFDNGMARKLYAAVTDSAAAQQSTLSGEGAELDLYDNKVQEGISWAMRQWGEALGLTTWTQGDGSESVEGDVGAEIHTILVDAGLRDPETNEMARLPAPPVPSVSGEGGR